MVALSQVRLVLDAVVRSFFICLFDYKRLKPLSSPE